MEHVLILFRWALLIAEVLCPLTICVHFGSGRPKERSGLESLPVKSESYFDSVPYGIWANESKSFLSEELVENKNLRVAAKGDVVIVAAGETIEDIGLGTAWLGDQGVVIHDACFSYRSPVLSGQRIFRLNAYAGEEG